MKNAYTIIGPKVHIHMANGPDAIIDLASFEAIDALPNAWFIQPSRHTQYAHMNVGKGGARRKVMMHRIVTGVSCPGVHTDHIDGNGLNNSRDNLRVCTPSENAQNLRGARSDSQSGIRGVSRRRSRYRARLRLNGQEYHLGTFDTIEEAERAVKEGRLKYHTHSPEAAVAASST